MSKTFVVLTLLVSAVVLADTQRKTDARSLFYDTTSDLTKAPGALEHKEGAGTAKAAAAAAKPISTGLMYYVELIQPGGEKIRVTTKRVFHSGDKLRLHVETKVDGRLVVLQRRRDGSAQVLFPDPRVHNGDNLIRAHVDTVVPSDESWFKFDDKPGLEKLTLLLATEAKYGDFRQEVAEARADSDRAVKLEAKIHKATQRDLIVEVDDDKEKAGTFVIEKTAAGGPDPNPASGMVTAEITLNHQ